MEMSSSRSDRYGSNSAMFLIILRSTHEGLAAQSNLSYQQKFIIYAISINSRLSKSFSNNTAQSIGFHVLACFSYDLIHIPARESTRQSQL